MNYFILPPLAIAVVLSMTLLHIISVYSGFESVSSIEAV